MHACNTARQAGSSRQTGSHPIDVRQPDAPTLQHPCVGAAAALGRHRHQRHRQHAPSHLSTAVLIGQQTRSPATRSPRQRSSNMSAARTHQTVRSATAHPAPARPLDALLTRHRPPAQEHTAFAKRSTAAGHTTSAPTWTASRDSIGEAASVKLAHQANAAQANHNAPVPTACICRWSDGSSRALPAPTHVLHAYSDSVPMSTAETSLAHSLQGNAIRVLQAHVWLAHLLPRATHPMALLYNSCCTTSNCTTSRLLTPAGGCGSTFPAASPGGRQTELT